MVTSTAVAEEATQGVRATLEYQREAGAEICPGEEAVQSAFSHHLGRGALVLAGQGEDGAFRVVLQMKARGGDLQEIEGHIELLGAGGKRLWSNDLRAVYEDCATLVASLALSLRIAADSVTREAKGPPVAAPAVNEPIVIRGVSLPPVVFVPVDPDTYLAMVRDQWPRLPSLPAFHVQAGAAVVFGAAPKVPVRLTLAAGPMWPNISLLVEARFSPTVTAHYGGSSLRVTQWGGALLPCAHTRGLFACGLVSMGGFLGVITGEFPDTIVHVHTTCGTRVGGYLALNSRFSILAYLDVEANLVNARVHVNNVSGWEESTVQVALGLAAAGAFPSIQQ
ncbi:MAG: hypothetical protein R3B70_43075 [Polyangiaceae bacterium]